MKCICGYDDTEHSYTQEPTKKFITVLGLLKTERTEKNTGNTFYQTTNLVACPECKTLRLAI